MKLTHSAHLLPTALTVVALCGGITTALATETTNRLYFDAATGLATPAWEKTGEIEVKTAQEGDIAVLDCDDQSATERFTYSASLKSQSASLQNGFALEFTAKAVEGHAHMIALMLPKSRFMFTLLANAKEQMLSFPGIQKSVSCKASAGAFHTWKIIFTPPTAGASGDYGSFAISLDGTKQGEAEKALKGNGQAVLTLGGAGNYVPAALTGRVLFQKFELRPAIPEDTK